MKFGIFFDNPRQAKKFFKVTEKRFNDNQQARQFVQREVKMFDFTSDLIVGIKFSTIFPVKMFSMISGYVLFLGIALQIILGFGFVPSLFGVVVLNLPSMLESPLFVYVIIKRQMKKFGYKGSMWRMSKKRFDGAVIWD